MEKTLNSVDEVSNVYQTKRVHPSNQSSTGSSKRTKRKNKKQSKDVVILTTEDNPSNKESNQSQPAGRAKSKVGSKVDIEA